MNWLLMFFSAVNVALGINGLRIHDGVGDNLFLIGMGGIMFSLILFDQRMEDEIEKLEDELAKLEDDIEAKGISKDKQKRMFDKFTKGGK